MIRYVFIHTKEDIKFLVLFAMDLLPFPVTFETVVDLITWCDDGFGYFMTFLLLLSMVLILEY